MKGILISPFLGLMLLFAACNTTEVNEKASAPFDTIQNLLAEGSCQYLTKDNNGNPVICWVKEDTSDKKNNIMNFAIWDNATGKFGTPVTIEKSKGVQAQEEGMSKIVFRKNGSMILMYSVAKPTEENKYAANVYYMMADAPGKPWTDPIQLVSDTLSKSQRFFDISQNPSGEVSVIWLDSRKEKGSKGSTLYYAETIPGKGFQNEKPIASTTCECCRTKIYCDEDNNLNIVYRDIINDSIRDMSFMRSTDHGKSFSEPVRISNDNWILNGCPHTGPDVIKTDGKLNFTWYTQGGKEGVYYCSSQDGRAYSERQLVSDNGRHPQIIHTEDKVHIIHEQIIHKDGGIDRPIVLWTLADDNKSSIRYITDKTIKASYPVIINNNGTLLVSWNQKDKGRDVIYYKTVQ